MLGLAGKKRLLPRRFVAGSGQPRRVLAVADMLPVTIFSTGVIKTSDPFPLRT
jgi:hypothetical protein